MSRDAEEARDLVQDTFVRLARHRALPAADGHAEAWLVKTLVHLCRDRERRLRVRQRHDRSHGGVPAVPVAAPEARVVARVAVQDALAHLSPRRRAVVALHDLEGQSASEIARLLGVSPVTVRWHLHAAHRDLRRILLREENR
jgi:RNA polymerase sigma-70 factor (ECF subfamily)